MNVSAALKICVHHMEIMKKRLLASRVIFWPPHTNQMVVRFANSNITIGNLET